MRLSTLLTTATILATTLATTLPSTRAATPDDPVPQTEESDILKLPPPGPHRVLVQDGSIRHAKDGRVYVVDGDKGKLLGMVQAAYNANVVADPKGRAFYVAETVWSRGNRGDRADLLPSYDPQTLEITNDLKLPGRALVTPKRNNLAISADGARVYVFEMVPTNAIHVIDTKTHSVMKTIDMPGCSLVYPWGTEGYTSICADGGLENVSLSPGHVAKTHTAPFFDPEKDAIFENSPLNIHTGTADFLSYSGLVYPASLSAKTTIGKPWSLQEAAGEKRASDATSPFDIAWRPGGWQLAALHHATHRLYVLMHKGTFWTHKTDGTEVWVFDTQAHKRVAVITLPEPSGTVGVTQDAHPLMFTTNENGGFYIWDAMSGKLLHTIPKLGEDLYFTETFAE